MPVPKQTFECSKTEQMCSANWTDDCLLIEVTECPTFRNMFEETEIVWFLFGLPFCSIALLMTLTSKMSHNTKSLSGYTHLFKPFHIGFKFNAKIKVPIGHSIIQLSNYSIVLEIFVRLKMNNWHTKDGFQLLFSISTYWLFRKLCRSQFR